MAWGRQSTDDGLTWTVPAALATNQTLGPSYGWNRLNHGIQLEVGRFAGRLAFAERYGYGDAHLLRSWGAWQLRSNGPFDPPQPSIEGGG